MSDRERNIPHPLHLTALRYLRTLNCGQVAMYDGTYHVLSAECQSRLEGET